jgi:hypothetical protein
VPIGLLRAPSGLVVPRRAELCPSGQVLPRRAEVCPVGPSCAHRAELCWRPSGRANATVVRVYEMMRLCVEMRMPITIVPPMMPITMVPITKV